MKSYQTVKFKNLIYFLPLDNLKGVYDTFGNDGLANGVVDAADGSMKGGYKFKGNSFEIFEKYFGTRNPHILMKDSDRCDDEFGTMFGSAFGGLYSNFSDPPQDLTTYAECTLEEIFKGGLKAIQYVKQVVNVDGKTVDTLEFQRSIDLRRGALDGEKTVFLGEGNQKPGYSNCKNNSCYY